MEAVEREILDFAERWARAMTTNDAAAIGEFMADDWIMVGENGTTHKPEFLSWIASGDLTHETMELIGEARIKVFGNTAVLTTRINNNGHYKNHPFSADEWTTDVFRKSENRWLCVLSHITSTIVRDFDKTE
jgi:ketosteroid isomerase-like protein